MSFAMREFGAAYPEASPGPFVASLLLPRLWRGTPGFLAPETFANLLGKIFVHSFSARRREPKKPRSPPDRVPQRAHSVVLV
jgi:hypothetical protein